MINEGKGEEGGKVEKEGGEGEEERAEELD